MAADTSNIMAQQIEVARAVEGPLKVALIITDVVGIRHKVAMSDGVAKSLREELDRLTGS